MMKKMMTAALAVAILAGCGKSEEETKKVEYRKKQYDSMPQGWKDVYQDMKPLSLNGKYDFLKSRIDREGSKLGKLTEFQMELILDQLAQKHQGKAKAELRPFTRLD